MYKLAQWVRSRKHLLILLAFVMLASRVIAAELHDLSATDANNTGSAANAGWPESMPPSAVNNAARALEGMIAREASDRSGDIKAYGSANAIRITTNRTISNLFDGLVVAFTATLDNTGSATLQLGSLTGKTINKLHDTTLAAGDIEQDQIVVVAYSSSDDTFQMLSQIASATSVTTSDIQAGVDGELFAWNSSGVATTVSAGIIDHVLTSRGAGAEPQFRATEVSLPHIQPGVDGELLTWSAAGVATTVTPGLAAQVLTSQGAGSVPHFQTQASSGGFTLGTEADTSSGTSHTWSGIPAGTTVIHLMFDEVSLDSTNTIDVTIGDSGGLETTGYVATSCLNTCTRVDSTAEFNIESDASAMTLNGVMILSLEDSSDFTWTATYVLGGGAGRNTIIFGGGSKSLSAELTQISISGGTFDNGAANISYQ